MKIVGISFGSPKRIITFAAEQNNKPNRKRKMETIKIVLLYGTGVALIAAGVVLKNRALTLAGNKLLIK